MSDAGTPSRDECSMALCAIRYTMGRRSYIVGDGIAWARRYGRASEWVRDVVIRDIEEALSRKQRVAGSSIPCEPLGSSSDEAEWIAVLHELRAIQDEGPRA